MFKLDEFVNIGVERVLENKTGQQIGEALRIARIVCYLSIKLVESHHSVVHEIDEGLNFYCHGFE